MISVRSFQLANKRIGPEQPVYIVAELSANHRNSFDHACKLIEAAHAAGADAVKLQTYTPDTLYDCSEAELSSRNFRRSLFITEDLPAGTTLQEEHVRSLRPAAGLAPKYREAILGRRLKVDVKRGTPLEWELPQ